MPVRPALALIALLLVLVPPGCAGDEEPAAAPLLDKASFKEVVAAAVRRETKLQASPAYGLTVKVEDDKNWIELVLDDAYARYRAKPSRRDDIIRDLVREAGKRARTGLDEDSFAAVRSSLRPLLRPKFAVRGLSEPPASRPFPANLLVTYAVEREHESFVVGRDDLARWGRSLAEVDRIAIANLARTTDELLCEEKLCGWASGDGYDATRMIVPKLRRDIVRKIGPAAFAVPMEHVFVAVPIRYAARIEQRVLHDFTNARDPVSPAIFVERRGQLVPLPS